MRGRFADSQMLHWMSFLVLVPLSLYVFLAKKVFGNKPVAQSKPATKQ